MEFSGRIDAFPPADLLQWAKNEQRTGALVFRRSDREKRVYFHSGEVVACLSNDPAEFFGQHLVLHGYIADEQLFTALTHCTSQGIRMGTALRELGMLSPEVIQQALREQIEDLVCDLFLWEHGIFYFQSELPLEEEILPEAIHTMGLVLEGSRWVDERERIRRIFVHDYVVLRRGRRWPGQELTPVRRRIAEAVDGRKNLKELYKSTRGSWFRFLEAAFGLCVDETLDIEEVGEPADTGTQQLNIYDLLLERATEEQVLVARRHMAIPLDLLERSFPVWIGEPNDDERSRMPTRARDFYARFDGQTPLAEAFSGDPRLRGREMDLLLLQLQKGRLALLPLPFSRLEEEADQRGDPQPKRWWRKLFPPATA
jgi:hypothetical protein